MTYLKIEFGEDDKILKVTRYSRYSKVNMKVTAKNAIGCEVQKHGKKGYQVLDIRYK